MIYRLNLLFVFMFLTFMSYSQSYKQNKNVFSTNLISPFLSPSSYSLEYERTLDKGYSPNVTQLSYKIGGYYISDKEKQILDEFYDQFIYDKEAIIFSGYSTTIELRYYFEWDAPSGYYFSLFGAYAGFNENYTDRKPNSITGYEKSITKIGRGVALGFKYNLSSILIADALVGYKVENVSENQVYKLDNREIEIEPYKKDGLRFELSIGLLF